MGQEYAIVNSDVPSKSEKSWDLQLRVPHNMFNGNLNFCNLIDVVWELRVSIITSFKSFDTKCNRFRKSCQEVIIAANNGSDKQVYFRCCTNNI